MEQSKLKLEGLLDTLTKVESNLDEVGESLDTAIKKLVGGEGEEELKPREEKALRYEVEDLEKKEKQLEEQYCSLRLEILRLRQTLRSQMLSASGKESKGLLNTLSSSTMYSATKRESRSIAVSRQNFNADQSGGRQDVVTEWQINPKEMEIDRNQKLGSGAFGDVFKGKLRGKEVAIKKLIIQEFDDVTLAEFKSEVEVMVKLRHPNVLLFMGACTSKGNLAMVTEFMPRGSVYDILKTKTSSIRTRLMFAKDTALGMNWLHCSNILHLDLKSQNLLVDQNYVVKVADFGLSQVKKSTLTTGKAGSPLYMAPEMLMDRGYDEKADVYSYGIVLWELWAQEEPYKGKFTSFDDLMNAVTKKGERPEIPKDCPEKLKDLITRCWNPDPGNRPTFAAILKDHLLDHVLIDALISPANEIGRKFWKTEYLEKTQVPWKEFIVAFAASQGFRLPANLEEDPGIVTFKELVSRKSLGIDTVTLDDFGKMLEWFGPLEKGNTIFRRMEQRLKSDGFWGFVEAAEAENLLKGKKKGAYLVRFSTKDPGSYAITVYSNEGTLKHFRVLHKAGGPYTLGAVDFPDLDALIKTVKKDLALKSALDGSKYEQMYIALTKAISSSGYMADESVHLKAKK